MDLKLHQSCMPHANAGHLQHKKRPRLPSIRNVTKKKEKPMKKIKSCYRIRPAIPPPPNRHHTTVRTWTQRKIDRKAGKKTAKSKVLNP